MKTSLTLSALASALVQGAAALFFDALSPPACAACDEQIPSRQVFCASCAATIVRDEPQADGSVTFARFGGAVDVSNLVLMN